MSRLEGFQTCPRCGNKTLPRIDSNSHATAVQCQACGQVIERAELEAIAERARDKTIEDAKKKATENFK